MFRHNLSNQFYKLNYFDLKEGLCLLILKSRIYEHEYSIITTNSECTMLANHSTNLKHNFNFSNPKILDKEHNLEKRLIFEMIEILNNKNSINKRSDMDCFSNVYKKCLKKNNSS